MYTRTPAGQCSAAVDALGDGRGSLAGRIDWIVNEAMSGANRVEPGCGDRAARRDAPAGARSVGPSASAAALRLSMPDGSRAAAEEAPPS
jgi:hypothetical protein